MPHAAPRPRPLARDATPWGAEQWGIARAYTLSTLDDLCAGDHRKRARLARFGAFGRLATDVAGITAQKPRARQVRLRRPPTGAAAPATEAAPSAAPAAAPAAAATALASRSGDAVQVQPPPQPQAAPRSRGRRGGARHRSPTTRARAAAAGTSTASPPTALAAQQRRSHRRRLWRRRRRQQALPTLVLRPRRVHRALKHRLLCRLPRLWPRRRQRGWRQPPRQTRRGQP